MKKINVFTKIKQALLVAALTVPFGNSSRGQVVFNEGFEASCSNYLNSFYLGCITNSNTGSNWSSASGTPDTQSSNGAAHGGSRYANCYANWDFAACNPPERSEGIVLNYAFQAGVTYKITYYAKGGVSLNAATQTHSAKWYLTNGLTNQTGGLCAAGEATPAIPSGSYQVPNNMSFSSSWTPNTHTFTPTSNFNQLWFRQATTSSVQNSQVNALIQLDDFTLEIICVPTPSISGPTSVCQGTPLSYTGSITNGCSITNNVWTVTETNQYGTPVSGATEWWSSWASGTPGTFNIPSVASGGPSMTCGKYYRIKLAVQNPYTSWTETIKIVYVNCLPSFNLNGNSTICWGESANLVATLNSGSPSDYTMTVVPVSPSGSTIYSGPMTSVAVSPVSTTTYQVTLTNNTTGCSSSLQNTVTVRKNDPGFIITTDITNPSYLQVTAAPNITSGQPAGFGYMWFVDELDGSWNTVYSVNSNDIASCWWPGVGSPTTFPGFDGLAQSYSNTCSPANGKFKYNTNYRITRGTWSTDCSWHQVSYILIYVKNGEWVFEEDHNAPDMSAFVSSLSINENKQDQLLLSPNPSNDKVTISMSSSGAGELKITDLSGRVVYSEQIKSGENSIELTVANYPAGTYLVQVVDNNNILSAEKLIITK